jgi:hypothetical protein
MPDASAGEASLEVAGKKFTSPVAASATEARFPNVDLPAGPARLEATLPGGAGPHYVDVRSL